LTICPTRCPYTTLFRSFVREGHGLIIWAGEHVVAETYNRILLQEQGLLPFKLSAERAEHLENPLHVDRNSANSAFFEERRIRAVDRKSTRLKLQSPDHL